MMEKNNLKSFLSNNPVMILFMASCPALATTTNLLSGLVIACAVFCIIVLSSLVMAILGKISSSYIRVPLCVIVTAGFSSIANMLISAFLPKVSSLLGVYVALCAINAMIVLKGVVASDSGAGEGIKNAVICGIQFAVLVIVMAFIRESLGLGTIAGVKVSFLSSLSIPILAKAPGAFIVFSILLALSSLFSKNCDTCCCQKEAK